MSSQIIVTGLGGTKFEQVLYHGLRKSKPQALGVAVAYVSVLGFQYIQKLVTKFEVKSLRLVTDTKDAITHPVALSAALEQNWEVRVVDSLAGTFHPKLYIGGHGFEEDEGISGVTLILSGSANLSAGALTRNAECSYLSLEPKLGVSAQKAWKKCWNSGSILTPEKLTDYEKYFALRNRCRSPADLITLGVADEPLRLGIESLAKSTRPPPDRQKAFPNTAATTAWVGLQSFTGDYNLQVEFPRDAGSVLLRLLSVEKARSADMLCEDGNVRNFIYRYYPHNGMFRLNVHNDTPSAAWAREHKEGIAVIESDDGEFRFRIIKPGPELSNVINRSVALGTWGKTTTRLYGWY